MNWETPMTTHDCSSHTRNQKEWKVTLSTNPMSHLLYNHLIPHYIVRSCTGCNGGLASFYSLGCNATSPGGKHINLGNMGKDIRNSSIGPPRCFSKLAALLRMDIRADGILISRQLDNNLERSGAYSEMRPASCPRLQPHESSSTLGSSWPWR